MSVFHRNITNMFSNFFPCQNRNLWLSIDILITYKYFLILAAELAKIKFLKSRKKPSLSDVLNFASLVLKTVKCYDMVAKVNGTDFFVFTKGTESEVSNKLLEFLF